MDKTISVIGLGYVGLPLALLAGRKGYKVIGIDNDIAKITKLKNKISPYFDLKIQEELVKSDITFTDDFKKVKESSISIICVPTPVHKNRMPDLRPVEGACKAIAPYLNPGHLVILESTVNPGVCESTVLPLLEKISKKKAGIDFYVAHCPERINPGDPKWNVENIPRVIGSLEQIGLKKGSAFYESIINAPIKKMGSLKEAEAVKVVENSFRDINIAFVNELALSFSKLGINVVNVINGAATKPFAFMPHYPGCGVGGHCIPVDPYYLIEYAKQNGFEHKFLSLARKINNDMPKFTANLAKSSLKEKKLNISGKKITVLGLAYKADIDDCRESPAFEIIEHLKELGAKVATFDPFVKARSTAKTIEEAVENASVVIVATAHKVFRELTPEFFLKYKVSAVIDGRNCLQDNLFEKSELIYKGIGTVYKQLGSKND